MSDLPVLKCKRINGCRWHDTEFDYNCEKYSHDTTLLVSCNGYLRKKESKEVFQENCLGERCLINTGKKDRWWEASNNAICWGTVALERHLSVTPELTGERSGGRRLATLLSDF
jgi:hypothetical protein